VDPSVAGALEGDADRVVEVAGGDLVVADEAGEDRQPGGVGGGPAVGAAGGGAQVPRGSRVGVPVRARLGDVEGAVELVELAGGAVDDETWRSPLLLLPPSTGALAGTGKGPGSLSSP